MQVLAGRSWMTCHEMVKTQGSIGSRSIASTCFSSVFISYVDNSGAFHWDGRHKTLDRSKELNLMWLIITFACLFIYLRLRDRQRPPIHSFDYHTLPGVRNWRSPVAGNKFFVSLSLPFRELIRDTGIRSMKWMWKEYRQHGHLNHLAKRLPLGVLKFNTSNWIYSSEGERKRKGSSTKL